MKIAIEAQRLFRPQKHGMDVVAYELLRRLPLQKDEHEYHVLVKDGKDKCIGPIGSRTIHAIQHAPYAVWEQALLPNYCDMIKADVLHCTASTAPLKVKQPLILTLHDVIFLEQSYVKASWYQRLGNTYRSTIIPAIAKKAEHIITVSEYQKNAISERLSIPKEKMSVIYNGVDDRFFTLYNETQITATLEKYGIEPGYIFFMANSDPRKNTIGVLNAYAMLVSRYPASPRLVIKGLRKEQLQHLLQRAGLLSLQSHIDLVGYVEHEDLPSLYQGSSMLWFPSFKEGFGLPIIEAMACGVPVITSHTSCMPEIGGDAVLYINPNYPQTITHATTQILEDTAIARQLSQRGRERARLFTWDNAAKKLVQIYNKAERMIS
ncbi:MAG: glycosyltransferase family 4 protein [Bacteroidota bacterium]|nr:glycosyltransferase family 4 protein [Bacteroidota bacterium]